MEENTLIDEDENSPESGNQTVEFETTDDGLDPKERRKTKLTNFFQKINCFCCVSNFQFNENLIFGQCFPFITALMGTVLFFN
jgi:hypothetical protein